MLADATPDAAPAEEPVDALESVLEARPPFIAEEPDVVKLDVDEPDVDEPEPPLPVEPEMDEVDESVDPFLLHPLITSSEEKAAKIKSDKLPAVRI